MGLLKRTEHDNLLDLLRAIPDYDDQQSRRLLKRKLPSEILDNIEDDGAPAIHLKNILRVVDTDLEYPSDNGIWPILTLVENAKIWAERFHFSPGINHVIDELNTLHKNLQERAIQHIPEISDHITSALVSAFPTRRKLELFALFSLNWNLENFYGNNLLELTTNLVNFAIKEKRLIFLIDAAMNASPHDPYIRAVAVAAHRCDPIDPPLPGEKLDGLQIQQLSIALAGAFIYQELRDITQLVLKKKLEEISLREELIDVAVDLVLASERYDVTYDLIKEALKERPINQVFLWFIGKSQSNFSKKPKRIEVRSAYSHDTIIE